MTSFSNAPAGGDGGREIDVAQLGEAALNSYSVCDRDCEACIEGLDAAEPFSLPAPEEVDWFARERATIWRETHHRRLLEAARELAALGFTAVPMIAAQKRPALKGWREAAADPARALAAVEAATWADALAIATGGGLLVLDVDGGHADNADGALSLAVLEAAHGPLSDGPRSGTPKGGVHCYFATPPGRLIRSRAAMAPGLDVRAEAGLAMCPPSPGRVWSIPLCPRAELPLAPAWLLDLADPPRPPPPPATAVRPWRGALHPWAKAAMERELHALATASVGRRNTALFAAAAKLGALAAGGALPVDAVARGLLAGAEACGLTHDDGEAAARATIASGLRAGLKRPRAVPPGGRRDG